MKSPKLIAVAALAIFAVAACGSSAAPTGAGTPTAAPGGGTTTTPAPTGGAVDMCALLSPADLKTVTGGDYGDGVLDSVGQCTWRVGGTAVNVGDGQVVAAIQDQQLSFIKSTFSGGVDVTVSGQAGYWNPEQGLQSIWVDVGGRTLVLSFDPVGPDAQAIAQKLAEIALSKM